MLVHEKGYLEFRADSVCAADEHGLCYARQVELEQTAEAAHIGADARSERARDVLFHQLHCLVSRGYVNARVGVYIGL